LAEDPETGEQGYFEVVDLNSHPEGEILAIAVEAEPGSDTPDQTITAQPSDLPILHITPEHPVYVEGKGWLNAENLTEGDRLRRSDGGYAKVLAIERVKLEEPQVVYNFTVKRPHTYFVLEVGVLVHNVKCLGDVKNKLANVFEDTHNWFRDLRNWSDPTQVRL
jgi:hypothetical protein